MKRNHFYAILDDNFNVVPVDTGSIKGLNFWVDWFGKANLHIRNDQIRDVEISTIFLGTNRGGFGQKDLWFETIIFGGEYSGWRRCYETHAEALKGHRSVVRAIRMDEKIKL